MVVFAVSKSGGIGDICGKGLKIDAPPWQSLSYQAPSPAFVYSFVCSFVGFV